MYDNRYNGVPVYNNTAPKKSTKKRRKRLRIATSVVVGVVAGATTASILVTALWNRKTPTYEPKLDKESSAGVVISTSKIAEHEESSVQLTIPETTVLSDLTVKVGSTELSKTQYTVKDNKIVIKADAMTSKRVTILAKTCPVDAVVIDIQQVSLSLGDLKDSEQLNVTVTPEYTPVAYESTNPNVVTVDEKGKVTKVGPGEAEIIVKAGTKAQTKTQSCRVTVVELSIDPTSITGLEINDTRQITATVLPESCTKKPTWTSSDPNIVTVDDNGLVTAVEAGSAAVTCEIEGVAKKTCSVSVKEQEATISLDKPSAEVDAEQEVELTATVSRDDVPVKWTVDEEYAHVVYNPDDRHVKVMAVKAIESVIVTAKAGTGVATFNLKINPRIPKIVLNETTMSLDYGQTGTLKATEESKYIAKIKWKSSDETVVKVTSTGEQEASIETVGIGTATITATSNGAEATCEVTVGPTLSLISSLDVNLNKQTELIAYVNPSGIEVTWNNTKPDVVSVTPVAGANKAIVKGLAEDVSEVTATINTANGSLTKKCDVRVKKQEATVKLDQTSVSVVREEIVNLKATINPSDVDAEWSYDKQYLDIELSDDKKQAKLTTKKEGTTIVTVTAGTGSASCEITITPQVPAIALDQTESHITYGQSNAIIKVKTAKYLTENITWTSSNQSIIKVSSSSNTQALIETVGLGTADLTASANGTSAKCTITVFPVLSLTKTSMKIKLGESDTLAATVTAPASAAIEWKTSNPSAVSLTKTDAKNVKLTALAAGSSTISCTVGGVTQTCTVNVKTECKTAVGFKNIGAGAVDIILYNNGRWGLNLSYSKDDGDSWNNLNCEYGKTTAAVNIKPNEKVMFRGNNPNGFNNNFGGDNRFIIVAKDSNKPKVRLTGSAMGLLDNNGANPFGSRKLPAYAFATLFKECDGLAEIEDTFLDDACKYVDANSTHAFYMMFYNCPDLVKLPKGITSSVAAPYMCYLMFANCNNAALTDFSAFKLSPTTLYIHCYETMFGGCAGMVKAPAELPAATFGRYNDNACEGPYFNMFVSCQNLTTPPIIRTTNFSKVYSCCKYMFEYCKKLNVSEGSGKTKFFYAENGVDYTDNFTDMFKITGGSFTGNPSKGKNYYFN